MHLKLNAYSSTYSSCINKTDCKPNRLRRCRAILLTCILRRLDSEAAAAVTRLKRFRAIRDATFFSLLFDTGARAADALKLKLGDVAVHNKAVTVHFRVTKMLKNKPHVCRLEQQNAGLANSAWRIQDLVNLIDSGVSGVTKQAYLFNSGLSAKAAFHVQSSGAFARRLKRLLPKKSKHTLHSFRVAAANDILSLTGSEEVTRVALGWKSKSMVKCYTRLCEKKTK